MKVAIQGELGSFSHEAVRTFLPGANVLPCPVSNDVFDALERGRVQFALLPIENSLAGSVAEHYDLLLSHEPFIQREFRLRIRHNLIVAPSVRLGEVKQVFSHPVALGQCREFFRSHRGVSAVPFYDTAGSVKHIVAKNLRDAAAIASREAAEVYGGKILLRGMEDDKRNFTRFVLLGRRRRVLPKADKTSVAFALHNAPGALFKALSVFALRDIDLSKIESRPMRGRPWEYVFHVDFLRGDDVVTRKALRHLEEVAEFVRVLGVYRRAN